MLTASKVCMIGPYGGHTANFEKTECIWCGPNRLAWMPGKWIPIDKGGNAWSATLQQVPAQEEK
jgi:hypothetical protein